MMCFSGRGGEVLAADGCLAHGLARRRKRRFRERQADVSALYRRGGRGAQFPVLRRAGELRHAVEPDAVEQRIGRIDRLGQKHRAIRIINLHYRTRSKPTSTCPAQAHRPVQGRRRQAPADPVDAAREDRRRRWQQGTGSRCAAIWRRRWKTRRLPPKLAASTWMRSRHPIWKDPFDPLRSTIWKTSGAS